MIRKCSRCELLPEIPSEPSRVFFVSVHELMLNKIKNFLERQGFAVEYIGDGLLSEVSNPRELLRKLFSELNFSKPELEDTSLVFLAPAETPSFKHFRNMKTLLVWQELLDAEDYLEILSEGRLERYLEREFG